VVSVFALAGAKISAWRCTPLTVQLRVEEGSAARSEDTSPATSNTTVQIASQHLVFIGKTGLF